MFSKCRHYVLSNYAVRNYFDIVRLLTPLFSSRVTLHADDEFIILGCDGIWDCLSNDQAVKYVRDRIDVKSPTEIGTEMLDDIISDDPRASQGIGGDNMTVMVIDLQPSTRAYR